MINQVLLQESRNGVEAAEAAPGTAQAPTGTATARPSRGIPVAAPSLRDVEARHIADLLAQHNNNRRKVADVLQISERTLYRKLKRYHLS